MVDFLWIVSNRDPLPPMPSGISELHGALCSLSGSLSVGTSLIVKGNWRMQAVAAPKTPNP